MQHATKSREGERCEVPGSKVQQWERRGHHHGSSWHHHREGVQEDQEVSTHDRYKVRTTGQAVLGSKFYSFN